MSDNDMENSFQKLLSRLKSPTETSTPVSASDVVAGFQNGRPESTADKALQPDPPVSSENPQDYLLKLLQSQTVSSSGPSNLISIAASPPTQAANGISGFRQSPFTYTNPFDQLTKPQPTQSPNPPSVRSTPKAENLPYRIASTAALASDSKLVETSAQSSSISQDRPVETVSEAVGGVGEEVEKQVKEALAIYDLNEIPEQKQDDSITHVPVSKKIVLPQDDTEDSASTASGPADWQADNGDVVLPFVYSLPMKPFASLAVISQKDLALPLPAADTVVFVVRSKKEFDQLDRNLVACTPQHIVYALKDKGIRVVDAQTGRFEDMFNDKHGDHVYSVLTCIAPSSETSRHFELAIATGAKGGLFWTKLEALGQRSSQRSFNFAPHVAEQDSAGPSSGLLKTRVKASNRHPQFFAYGRGKYIHFVWPSQASSSKFTDSSTALCDSERYLASTNVRIAAGKAAKDFAFSVDDTVIASLDKAGKLKFWDIHHVTSFDGVHNETLDYLIDTPIMVFNTTQPGEKSWPTSVMFVDKEKTMTKGYACRYLIIGMKQNHVIQIWDLALGKPVQEITFPHGDESDPLLSLAYCPRSATLAVGHPVRNSIFLLHVSYPPYKYHPFSQAKFLSLLADKEKKAIPPPASTTIVDHIQEYSLSSVADVGDLRSFDLMVGEPEEAADSPGYMCTLICMHSKGIFQYALTKPNLGLGEDGNGSRSVDGIESCVIEIKDILQPIQDDNITTIASKSAAETPVTSEKDKKKKKKVESTVPAEAPLKIASPAINVPSTISSTIPSAAHVDWKSLVSEVVKTEISTLQKSLEKTRHDDHLFFTGNQTEILKLVEQSLQANLVTWRTSFESAVDRSVDRSVRAHLKDATALTAKDIENRYYNALSNRDAKLHQQNQMIMNLNNQIDTLTAKYEAKLHRDAQAIEQLTGKVNTLTDAITTLAKFQADLQADIVSRLNSLSGPPTTQMTPRLSDPLFQEMQDLINRNRFDEALVLWLRSPNQVAAFDEVFAKYTPDVARYIQNTNHLIILSLIPALSISLDKSMAARLEWLEKSLERLELSDAELKTHFPKVMNLLIERLQTLYEVLKSSDTNQPIMIKVHNVGHRATELKRTAIAEYPH